MAATPEDLFARFDELGIRVTTHHHRPVFTVEESRFLRGELPGGHCKTLFLRTKKGEHWLVVADEERSVNIKALSDALGVGRFSFASAARLMDRLGVTPGSVTPFALINDRPPSIDVVLDQGMLAHDVLNYHPLVNHMTTAIARDDLLRFVEACGHQVRVLDLDALT